MGRMKWIVLRESNELTKKENLAFPFETLAVLVEPAFNFFRVQPSTLVALGQTATHSGRTHTHSMSPVTNTTRHMLNFLIYLAHCTLPYSVPSSDSQTQGMQHLYTQSQQLLFPTLSTHRDFVQSSVEGHRTTTLGISILSPKSTQSRT